MLRLRRLLVDRELGLNSGVSVRGGGKQCQGVRPSPREPSPPKHPTFYPVHPRPVGFSEMVAADLPGCIKFPQHQPIRFSKKPQLWVRSFQCVWPGFFLCGSAAFGSRPQGEAPARDWDAEVESRASLGVSSGSIV